MRLIIPNESPALLRFVDFEDPHDTIKVSLSYTDKAAQFAYLRFKKNSWLLNKMGAEKFEAEVAKLKAEVKKSLLMQDDKGYYTFAGLAEYLSTKTGLPIENQVQYPEPNSIPWENVPPYKPHEFQSISIDKLMATRHAGVEIGTGLGKSFIIQLLCRSYGVKTIVMTPSTSISEQLYRAFSHAFGKKKVGKFFDGKKESNKLITIANAQSLTKVVPGTPHYENLAQVKMFIADESHQCPANTLAAVCIGVGQYAPYRYFFSATQLRADGRDMMLEGITGPIVYKKTVFEGVNEGLLAKPIFRIVKTKSDSQYHSSDANQMTRTHLYYNDNVNKKVGKVVNASVDAGRPVLVLIEEVEQFTKLLPYLRHEVKFAHGPLGENKSKVPAPYWDCDITQLVDDFNARKFPILVGTSCISTGTDIKAVKTLVFLQGGKSEVGVRQAIGRATRREGKTDCVVVDVDVYNVDTLARHYRARRAIYESLYPDVKELS